MMARPTMLSWCSPPSRRSALARPFGLRPDARWRRGSAIVAGISRATSVQLLAMMRC